MHESPFWGKLEWTTDFFHRNYDPISGVPSNLRGRQEPAIGDGYAGIRVVEGREYLVGQLIEPLETGRIYHVRYKASLSERSRYASDNIGITFLNEYPKQEDLDDYFYHVRNPPGQVLTDTAGWMDVGGYYLATGGERFLLIGSLFTGEDGSVALFQENASDPWAYYYIDDVSVQACNGGAVQTVPGFDTLVCAGNPVALAGLPGADGYHWEGLDARRTVSVKKAGQYRLYNFFGCSVVEQLFTVRLDGCDCTLALPGIASYRAPLGPKPSLNVRAYQWQLFDAAGRLVLTDDDTSPAHWQLPAAAGMYFWQASLACVSLADIPFERRVSGKVVLVE